jgi:hypothetical protein
MKKFLRSGIVFIIILCSLTGAHLLAQIKSTEPGMVVSSQSIAVVGVEYKYQVPGLSGVKVVFKLQRAPAGMSIDSVTGIVKWTPKVKGTFSVEVRLTHGTKKVSSYSWTIQVVNFLGTIKGIVKNETGEPLRWILVSVYKKTDRSATKYTSTQLSSVTDTAGAYSVVLADSGEFYIYASPGPSPLMSPMNINGSYIPVWYINSPTMDSAKTVLVKNASPIVANFILKKYQKPVPVTMSGTVSNAEGKPIAGATVVASVVSDRASSSAPSVLLSYQDPGFGIFCDVGAKERSDSLGHYKLSIKSGSSYIVTGFKEGYILQYYNGKSNILEADKVTVSRDTSGINFKLSAVPVATSKVSGVVLDSARAGVPARVILYPVMRLKTTTPVPTPVTRTINTDSLGVFSFLAVAGGNYLLQVVPLGKYMPAYYKANDCNVREVKYADTILVKENQNVSGLIVCVKKVVASGGGTIKGTVRGSSGSGVPGVVVFSESQNSSSYGITENDGSYEVTGLDPGAYTVITDKIGYTSSVTTAPVIDYAMGVFNSQANFILTEQITTSVETSTVSLPEGFVLYRNYPNPFNPSTQISFDLPAKDYATLRVYNMLGQVVATLVDGTMTAGKHNITFEAGNTLSSGVYVYELRYRDRIAVNKMILMK